MVSLALGYGAAPALADLPIRSSIETGTWGSCGLTASGDGVCWGYTDFTGEPPTVVEPAERSYQSPVPLASISIDPGNANSCALNVAGRAWCWKNLWGGALEPPQGTTFQSVSAGSDFNCGVTSGWDALCWGPNTYGGTTVPANRKWLKVSAGGSGQACGVTTSNIGHCWGRNSSGYAAFLDGRRWADLRAGAGFSCGVTTAGEGLCSNGVDFASLMPAGKTWAMVDPGSNGTVCGITTDGDGYCAGGFQSGGGLGGGVIIIGGGGSSPSSDTGYAVAVPTGYKWRTLSAGSSAACGITTTNEAKCWGSSINASIPSGLQWGSPAVSDPVPDAVSTAISFYGPASLTSERSATSTFTMAATYGAISCNLDDSGWGACPGFLSSSVGYSTTVNGLSLGAHTLSVRRADADGAVLASGSTSWTVRAPEPQSDELSSSTEVIALGTVGKGKTLKSSGWELPALAPGSPGPLYRWQRCDASGDESSCIDIASEAGATGAWWGTRNSDIGKRLRVKVTFTNLANVLSSVYSSLSSVIGSISVDPPELDYGSGNSNPVVGTGVHSSFGTWAGYVAGVSTVVFQWQTCSASSDPGPVLTPPSEPDCTDLSGSTGQWYRPRAADAGRRLRVRATLTTRGQSNVAASAVSGVVVAPVVARQSAMSPRRSVGGRPARPGRSHR